VKLLAGPAFTADALKFGVAAPPLPPRIAEALRSIEKTAKWGTFRLDLLSP
jgi:hypothetical protein